MIDETHASKALPRRNIRKYIALFFWLGIILAYQWYANVNDLSPL
jgi:hypothetical protein